MSSRCQCCEHELPDFEYTYGYICEQCGWEQDDAADMAFHAGYSQANGHQLACYRAAYEYISSMYAPGTEFFAIISRDASRREREGRLATVKGRR